MLEPSVPYPVATEIIANVVTSPHHLSATMVTGREHRMTEVFARLAPGATLEAARAELSTVYAAMLSAHPDVYKPEDHYTIMATRMHDQINSRANTILWVLFAASGLLFVIACSNVANLVLARTVRRESELAVRSALGASTSVLRRALLAEGLVLCGSGAIAAVLLAVPMVAVLGRYAARFSVRANDLTLDFSLVWFGSALAIAAAVFLAYIPRLPSPGCAAGRPHRPRHAGGRRKHAQAAHLCRHTDCRIFSAACRRVRVDEDAVRAGTDAPALQFGQCAGSESARDVVRKNAAAGERVLSRHERPRCARCPGWRASRRDSVCRGAASRRANISFSLRRKARTARTARMISGRNFRSISPGFFGTLGVPLLEGRDFNDGDKEGIERVVIISQSLAQMLYPGQDAVNRTMWWTDGVMKFIGISTEPRRIIAVVPDFDDENIIPAPAMTIYQPIDQEGWSGRLFVRAHQDPYALVPAITRTIHEMSADQPVERASTLNDVRAEVLTPDRLNAIVFGGFAAVALLISVVGVAGVLAFSVSGRTREIRHSHGAGRATAEHPHQRVGRGLVMAGIGVGAGVLVGFVLTRDVSKLCHRRWISRERWRFARLRV